MEQATHDADTVVSMQALAHVLVVDDEPDIRLLLRHSLTAAGYQVRTAADGDEALAALAEHRVDLVLLDVMMPRLDGWEVLRRLQEDPSLAQVPVVLVTALSSERDRLRGVITGAVRTVTKPFRHDPLLEVVREALAPQDGALRATRRDELVGSLRRLAAHDAGRPGQAPAVHLSRLEHIPTADHVRTPDRSLVARLTDNQHQIARSLARGTPPRQIATALGVSRTAVYATRSRIADHLGIAPSQVAEVCRRLGLDEA